MARSERAKELEAKQKAEAKALREKKRNSDNPRDWGTFRQIRESFRLTSQVDPQLKWWIIVVIAAGVVIGLVLGLVLGSPGSFTWIWGLVLGLLSGVTASLYILTWRTKKATYLRYKGQPGSGEVPLSMLNKKKWTSQPVIAFTKRQDVIHRVVGEGGLVLVGDGDPGRLKPLMATEVRRHQQVLYGVDVQTVIMGDGPDQVPMEKLTKYIEKLPKALDTVQVEEVKSRLKALDSMKSAVPLPKGPLPTNAKGSRRALRGR
ncbi:DUF4191 domain-containing protein [Brooklawnia cerclae]|uniref:DUF4191 domain-containing protein n=1 Tax=Brooklawnia cerclae TaxID=349934 RepID=A0ABX0SKJ4_9ACTN|nr:DUF4191 domain-containing protein [Brooklawnia cerclae]NIH57570.1 hypothetical protein [Brooklawnia cerclae]